MSVKVPPRSIQNCHAVAPSLIRGNQLTRSRRVNRHGCMAIA
jgi:hypothetical protein